MNKTELESKHIAELHVLAAEAGIEGYRMLRRDELIEKLADGKAAKDGGRKSQPRRESTQRERPQRRRRERPPRKPAEPKREAEPAAKRPAEPKREARPATKPAGPAAEPDEAPASKPAAATHSEPERPRRRRRRFGRRKKTVGASDLLLPPPGRHALVYGETRAACSALLLELAAELASASKGPDPIALLVDPSPEELAGWRREVPQAEIVAAGKDRHATDAVAQAARRAEDGEDVILLVDSLSRLEDAGVAREIFDSGAGASTSGSLTVVAALERQQ